ncbi:CRISPR-associated endonuclease Cas2 [Vineibacter terrae]|uniref:CRISPR-associated endoribonuclease Cas2 n=1 Tax=Vineibacter terrae TaxID=2586908 RepID=A0A5C8PVP5_9HYPH|nr:CRISPR-associated endonuclease Cas2 [Vineibacter terrae]TXL82053.1 CRISPR-associated endonuclease Cas2 [Vineibacter terrae]
MSRSRPLHIVSYDIAEPARLARVHDAVKEYSTGGQKSVHECFLSPGELAGLRRVLGSLVEPREDSVFILRLDPRMGVHALGIAVKPRDEPFFYVG